MRLKHTYIFSWEFLNSWYRTAMLGKFYKDYTALTFEAKVLVKKVKMEMKIELKKKGKFFSPSEKCSRVPAQRPSHDVALRYGM